MLWKFAEIFQEFVRLSWGLFLTAGLVEFDAGLVELNAVSITVNKTNAANFGDFLKNCF